MGTLFTFRASGDPAAVGRALDAALDSVASLEARLSNWRSTSELSRLNSAGSGELSPALAAVLDSALALARSTNGAFDPTVEPLSLAWDLRGEGRVPSAHELAAARARVGWERVRLGGTTGVQQRADLGSTALDLGGIGKGFALDRAVDVLRARGLTRAALDAGGQWLVFGAESCSLWVAHPADRDRPAVHVAIRDGSLSTSAQSERFVRAGGRRIGHVLDPRTGQPLATRASVTVWASSGTRADALSTALLVMGHDGARAFAAAHPDVGVLWLEPQGRRVVAHAWNLEVLGLAPEVSLTQDPSPTTLHLTQGRP
jgi:thiamine biosynthesis lipoprotein